MADVVDVGFQVAAMVASEAATALKIREGIRDYESALVDVQERIDETGDVQQQRVSQIRKIGELELRARAAQGVYEAKTAITQAELVAGAEEARLGRSGVRFRGSPLASAQQNVDLAYAAADRSIEASSNQIAIGGVRMKQAMDTVRTQASLVTNEYKRTQAELTRKRDELAGNRTAYLLIAGAGAAGSLSSSFYKMGSQREWWG